KASQPFSTNVRRSSRGSKCGAFPDQGVSIFLARSAARYVSATNHLQDQYTPRPNLLTPCPNEKRNKPRKSAAFDDGHASIAHRAVDQVEQWLTGSKALQIGGEQFAAD